MSNKTTMQLGMIGLGRMGANMVKRLIKDGHQCVVFDRSADAVKELTKAQATGASSIEDFVKNLNKTRAIWLMVPAAVVDSTICQLTPLLESGDILIDGGNSYYVDDIRRAPRNFRPRASITLMSARAAAYGDWSAVIA